ncbi:TPA: hypothetical protein ACX6NR_000367 [Photobacterium damselae]
MQVTHTSPSPITTISAFGGCTNSDVLFFSTNDYAMGEANYIYDLELNDDEIIATRKLYCEQTINEIAELFDCDDDTAESLLDGSTSEWDFDCGEDGEKSWKLQALRAKAAKNMGYVAVEDEDENGTVFIICMLGLESKLIERK